jgi:hypothetical protein
MDLNEYPRVYTSEYVDGSWVICLESYTHFSTTKHIHKMPPQCLCVRTFYRTSHLPYRTVLAWT